MSQPFRAKITAALQDAPLQAALDGNAERRRNARQQAYASLPEPLPDLRQRAKAIRADVIANLERYLDQFIARARGNGWVIHRAVDSHQAVEVVRQISSQRQARLISKSKTMVGEEIHLNQELEADGFEVIETDLGEYIVQLRGEPPAHIITPAVHLSRAQVGKTFQEKLGLPFTDDIPTLTAAARRVLRETFLKTDIGISGANFGIVETGAICLVTNEGNGRMVTTLPKVHIALMGIERLAPTLDDLALLLSLLPRSATGQKLSVYTSLIHGPRQPGESDGAEERHLILVDNGRQTLSSSPLAEILQCIRCGACLNVCPVFREIGGHAYVSKFGQHTPYPGPIGSVISPALFGSDQFGQLARASSLCGACKEACPVDIDIPKLLLRIRAGETQKSDKDDATAPPTIHSNTPPALQAGLHLFTWAAVSSSRFSFAQRLAGALGRLAAPRIAWLRLPALTGWGSSRDFPRPAARSFHQRFARLTATPPNAQSPVAFTPLQPAGTPEAAISQPVDLIERFTAELVSLGGQVQTCSEQELATKILEFLHHEQVRRIQAWEADRLPPRLLDTLVEGGIEITHDAEPDIQVGLTGALAGIADTGTLALAAGPGQPQCTSLLPEIHLAVLRGEQVYENLAQLFSSQGEVFQKTSVVLVTGPSRTADIEMTLTIGVHGPRQVHVFCI